MIEMELTVLSLYEACESSTRRDRRVEEQKREVCVEPSFNRGGRYTLSRSLSLQDSHAGAS